MIEIDNIYNESNIERQLKLFLTYAPSHTPTATNRKINGISIED